MSRFFAIVLIGIGGALASPASACLNDVELPRHEWEFRSEYGDPSPYPEAVRPDYPMAFWGPIGGGVGMLLLAGLVTTRAGHRPKG